MAKAKAVGRKMVKPGAMSPGTTKSVNSGKVNVGKQGTSGSVNIGKNTKGSAKGKI